MTLSTIPKMFETAVSRSPDAPALIYFDTCLSYAELDRLSNAFAGWLTGAGTKCGERLAVQLQNVPQMVIASLAAWKIGAVVMPCNPGYGHSELAALFADGTPRAILCETANETTVRAALDAIGSDALTVTTDARDMQSRDDERVFNGREPAEPSSMFRQIIENADEAPLAAFPSTDDLALLLYTSGTTGKPKGVELHHSHLVFNALVCRDAFSLGPHSRILAIAPLFHITGLVCHVLSAFAASCPLVLAYRFHPQMMLDLIAEHRPTFTIGAITAFNALLQAGRDPDVMRSFDLIYSGGAPIPPALRSQFASHFGRPIHTSYGMTETAAPALLCPAGVEPPIEPNSGMIGVGLPVRDTEICVVDEAGRELPAGQAGELLVRGPQVMAGYWQKQDETDLTLADGWMHTGDIAVIDEDGWCYIVDRKKDMICASGFKVWPAEVEEALYTLDPVREAVVVGKPDPYRGETVKAYVSLKAPGAVDAEKILTHARSLLAAYKCPREVEILDELPKTPTGKLSRLILRERAASGERQGE